MTEKSDLVDIEPARPFTVDAFVALLADDARFYAEGPPIFGAAPIRRAVGSLLTLEPAGSDIAAGGDLGYTYGTWRSANANGHYVHLWSRDARGVWRIAIALRL